MFKKNNITMQSSQELWAELGIDNQNVSDTENLKPTTTTNSSSNTRKSTISTQ
jgi:hypothetical protein